MIDTSSNPIRPTMFRERTTLMLARLFPSPIEWDGSSLPAATRLPDINLMIAAGDGGLALDWHRVMPVAKKHGCDVLATYVDQWRSGHVVHFDIALHEGSEVRLYSAYRLWIAPDNRGWFVAEGEMEGSAVALLPGGLVAEKRLPFATKLDRMAGLARGQALLDEMLWARSIYASKSGDRETDQLWTLLYPDKLIVLFPMHEARAYRRALSAVDDALVFHRRPDGEWLLELRPIAKLGPRRYAGYLRRLTADLEAGYTLVIVERDAFLEDLTELALANASSKERGQTARAAQVIAERRRYQTRNHDEAIGLESRFGLELIVSRKRRTRPHAYERNINSVMCRFNVPTPRSEQLWHVIRSDLCAVRSEQQGMVAWERWTQRNRPDMTNRGKPSIHEAP